MQIVIDIDDMAYKFVQDASFVEDENTMFEQTNTDRKKTLLLFDILDAIKNGIPLPKGHEKLIDADDLIAVVDEEIRSLKDMHDWGRVYGAEIVREIIKDEPTIIKADKESEGKE